MLIMVMLLDNDLGSILLVDGTNGRRRSECSTSSSESPSASGLTANQAASSTHCW